MVTTTDFKGHGGINLCVEVICTKPYKDRRNVI